ncbi:DUF1016 N-terminal domain-containing protein [Brevibacterium sp. GP-SGM9]|uniref:DUF1016 N-terminal domain-containing protein n=1 Tax=Brevibacterium sp. GP-SGM9 TaxID=3376990 RepID=UPI0039A654E1
MNRLAADLRSAFPDMRGLSRKDLFYMRSFARAWPEWTAKVPQAVGIFPWGHIRMLLDKVDSQLAREWYAAAAAENGWSRNVLEQQISSRLIDREGNASSNFAAHLEKQDSALARHLTKDPFVFDFLALGSDVDERPLVELQRHPLRDELSWAHLSPAFPVHFAFISRTDATLSPATEAFIAMSKGPLNDLQGPW